MSDDPKKDIGKEGTEKDPGLRDVRGDDVSRNESQPDDVPVSGDKGKKIKKRLVKSGWVRIPLKVIGWILLIILLLPVLLYIPPVQTLVKNIACSQVEKSTGMKIGIGEFRLRFPLDVELSDVSVVEATGDTMVLARNAIADVKLLPLLGLDVRLNALRLQDGYYRMVSPDSSMIMKIRAGLLDVEGGSYADMRNSEISLRKAKLRDGDVSLYMNVWKQQNEQDTTSTPFLIIADDLDIENIRFGMSMLPTIDTLDFVADHLILKQGRIDLRTNTITARHIQANGGSARYLTPTPEYIASHPVPASDSVSSSPPMKISVDSIGLAGFKALYAVKGAKPVEGFDANYISFDDLSIGMRNFYNEATTVRLPVTRLEGRERCGLRIVSGGGLVLVDSTGLALDNVVARTPFSNLSVTAGIPFSLMEMAPDAPLNAVAEASIGLPDVESFMPMVKTYTQALKNRNPLTAHVDVAGTLSSVNVARFDAAMKGLFSLRCKGYADNALDFKKLRAQLDIDGELSNPDVVTGLAGLKGISVPPLKIKGTAGADRQTYRLDMSALTPQGSLAAKGGVSLTSEQYDADVRIKDLNIAYFMKDLGIGHLTADLTARGGGFNPEKRGARTDIHLNLHSVEYNHNPYRDILARVQLENGVYSIDASSPNPNLDFYLAGNGTIEEDNYTFDIQGKVNHVDLQALGFSDTMNNGNADFSLTGTASPARWLYDADLAVENIDWNMPDMYIHLPSPMTARLVSTSATTECDVKGYETALHFRSESGLERLIDSFSSVATDLSRQLQARHLDVDSISARLPRFELMANASGRGMLNQFLGSSGMQFDSVSANLRKDSLIHCDASLWKLKTESLAIDTITLGMQQRDNMLDYAIHMGNLPGGPMDEFANVNLTGYMGDNRLSAFIRQQNGVGKTGYRLGFTAGLNDSTVSVHFTPLKATIAYMPWEFNLDNHVDFNYRTFATNAKLQASSAGSSILLMTEPNADGSEDLHINLKDIKVEDFLKMSVTAPPITATVNSDIRVSYNGEVLKGKGSIGITDLTYEKQRVGDFDLSLIAGRSANGRTRASVGLKIDGRESVGLFTDLVPDSVGGLVPKNVQLKFMDFPLHVANPFLGGMASLEGGLNGRLDMKGSFSAPLMNGEISLDSVLVRVPMIGGSFNLRHDPLTVSDNVVGIKNFLIYGANSNPLAINGEIDARNFSRIGIDINAAATNMQLVNSDKRSRNDIAGKLFVTLTASAKGNTNLLDVNASLNVLGTTDIVYTTSSAETSLTDQSAGDIVKFVNFNDSVQVEKADSVSSAMRMRINAGLTISQGTNATVVIAGTGVGSGRVELTPSGNVTYFQNYMGDMTLNGQINLGSGFVRYNIPVMGEKKFIFREGSYVSFTGPLMNPSFNIQAYDPVKVNVSSGGTARMVNFIVDLSITNNLNSPKVMFDMSAEDDMALENELSSMSPDQRSATAMNMLITGQYTGAGAKNINSNLVTSNLYGFLTSQLNNWAANAIHGVDLSFGVNQYESGTNGENSTATSYSYQVSKSLLNNRLKIIVGGNYSTDASADENLSQNLISDISFEYMIRQTNSMSLAAKLFRHKDFENILEGEITETGVGLVLRRQLSNLNRLFRFRFGRRRNTTTEKTDSAAMNEENTTTKTAGK